MSVSHSVVNHSAADHSAAFRPHRPLSTSRRSERRAAGFLTLLALGVGGWALYPEVNAVPRLPSVSRVALPPLRTAAAPAFASTPSLQPLISGRLNLNTASDAQLEALPGVGPAFAARLKAARPYRRLADLDAVPGVGPKMLAKLAPLVTF